MTPFSIAGVQMTISALHKNVTAMTSKIEHVMALFPWVEMIVFSELAPYGPLPSNCPESLVETEHTFREYARRHGVWLIPGTMFVRESDRLYNEALVINPDGDIVAGYRKMLPFAPYECDVTGGTDVLVFDVPGVGRFGLSICYDIWFPETTRQLTAMVRRRRTVGLRGLGQTLKSFRDHRCNFPIYEDDQFDTAYLDSLGPLVMPKRGTTQGIGEPAPEKIAPPTEPGKGASIH